MILDDALERAVGGALLLEVFDDRFDDQIAAGEWVEGGAAGKVAERLLARLRRDLALHDPPVEKLPNAAEALFKQRFVHFADDRGVAGRRADLRDARPHQPATQHSNRL